MCWLRRRTLISSDGIRFRLANRGFHAIMLAIEADNEVDTNLVACFFNIKSKEWFYEANHRRYASLG